MLTNKDAFGPVPAELEALEKAVRSPHMGFQDFLEHVDRDIRQLRNWIAGEPRLKVNADEHLPELSKTHLFHMGDDEDIVAAIRPIEQEIMDECREGIPMPFSDVACVSSVDVAGVPRWIMDRVILNPASVPIEPPEDMRQELEKKGRRVLQRLLVIRHSEYDYVLMGKDVVIPSIWQLWYVGVEGEKTFHMISAADPLYEAMFRNTNPGVDPFQAFHRLAKESIPILEQLAAISHPQNYVVRVTPQLTPREARRAERGEPRPVRKSPHFIVVDHEVLSGMNRQRSTGTHASPVPHERRGHWRRLSERCRQARLLGRDKIFVRPSYVGERVFQDDKNQYEVLLDFGKTPTNGTVA